MHPAPRILLTLAALLVAGPVRGAPERAEPAAPPVALDFDATRGAGRVLAIGPAGQLVPLAERAGWRATGLHRVLADGRPGLLVLWRDAAAGTRAAAELFVLDTAGAWVRVPRGEDGLPTFARARLEVREAAGKLALVVEHRYGGENPTDPITIRELWRPSAKGLFRDQDKLPAPTGPDQRLNLAAWLLEQGRPGDAAAVLAKLPKDDPDLAERAAMLLARHAHSGPTRTAARAALAAIAESDSPRAATAANLLMSLGWDEVAVRAP